ncbi:RNA recognition motif (RRM, RBD, or RNP domain) [Novymonas esmeraldas]|uniref:RNA recognition motif (RRM, RBD, or RNP domain) n=1 Tax=Novymonas esmeraldas TaxID=1808958 RepID=A0AAW0EUF3_9TRYP
MDSDLSAEIARIEAELAQDAAMRQQAQPQQQQQQHPPASMFGFGQTAPAAPPPQQQQQQSPPQQPQHTNPFNVNATPFMPTPQQQPDFTQQQQQQFHAPQQQQQQQQQFMSGAGQAAAASAGMHSFSKDTDSRSIFIGNLPRGTDGAATTTPEELVQFFADCGSILNCTVLKDRATGELKGTAYIEFSDYTAMGKAIDTKNNANFKGSPLIVCVSTPSPLSFYFPLSVLMDSVSAPDPLTPSPLSLTHSLRLAGRGHRARSGVTQWVWRRQTSEGKARRCG